MSENESEPHAGGRPPFEPTQEQRDVVTIMYANGIPHHIIARTLGIAPRTLRKAFHEELRDARIKTEAAMGAALVRAANSGAWGAARYWLMVHGDARWRVPERHMLGGDPSAPPLKIAMDVTQMTDVEIDLAIAEIEEKERIVAELHAAAATIGRRLN